MERASSSTAGSSRRAAMSMAHYARPREISPDHPFTMNDYLLRLVAHMRWADTLVADALDDTNAPQPDADAARLFAHIAAAEHLWLARIKAQTPRVSVWPPLSPAEARALAAEAANAFEQLLSNADGDALARRIHYTNSAGKR